jgi:hypothetical protein
VPCVRRSDAAGSTLRAFAGISADFRAPPVALALHARAMQALAQPAMCRRSAEQALALREAALSANDPQIVRSLDILAGCLIDLGAPTSALRVLDDASARLGDDPADAELAVTLRDTRARVTAVAEPGRRSPAD